MFSTADVGHLRTIYINDFPLAVSSIDDFFPSQKIESVDLMQGGPRSVVYSINEKTIEGTIKLPLYLDKNGSVAEGCREVIRCADNPLRNAKIVMNFGVMGEPKTATTYTPRGTSTHKRLTLEWGVITNMTLNIERAGNVTLDCKITGLPDPNNENPYNFDLPTSEYMKRQCSFADCLVTTGLDPDLNFKDDLVAFNLNVNNKIDPVYLIRPNSTDYAASLAIQETIITGNLTELKKIKEWRNERQNWNHGGYQQDESMKIYIADIKGTIKDLVYKPQKQPLGVGILKKEVEYIATWRYGLVDDTHNLVFGEI